MQAVVLVACVDDDLRLLLELGCSDIVIVQKILISLSRVFCSKRTYIVMSLFMK